MSSFQLSQRAKTDLREIHAYIAADSAGAADRLIDRLFDDFQRLATFPELGVSRDDLRPGIRIWPEGHYVILYRRTEAGVGIVHVIHGARDIEMVLTRRSR